MEQEHGLLQALGLADRARVDGGGRLVLLSAEGDELLHASPREAAGPAPRPARLPGTGS